ncbi:hypothetical protein M8J76_015227 [Diaphorina citri]|nr:hypothetical protein M8J76_015227 [Diaphorina citri]
MHISALYLLLLATLLFAICLWKRRKLYVLSYKLDGPFALPLIGNALLLLGGPEKAFETVHTEYYKHR